MRIKIKNKILKKGKKLFGKGIGRFTEKVGYNAVLEEWVGEDEEEDMTVDVHVHVHGEDGRESKEKVLEP